MKFSISNVRSVSAEVSHSQPAIYRINVEYLANLISYIWRMKVT